jgi:hypothetical protein
MTPTILSGSSEPGGAVAGPDWWDPNSEALCIVGAYRAINTPGNPWPNDAPAIYIDTLVNNANPGVNDLTEGNGPIPWVAVVGWSFVAAAVQWFDTGIVPGTTGWSMLAQYANGLGANAVVCGQFNGFQTFFELWPWNAPGRVVYGNGNITVPVPGLLTGNIGIGGFQGYRNGIADGGPIGAWSAPTVRSIYIGRRNGIAAAWWFTGDIESVAIYNCTLTAPQMLAVATAMTAL